MALPVRFGLNVDPNVEGLAVAEHIARIADVNGLDYVGVQDHPYNSSFVDTFSQLSWLAAKTNHVHLLPNVANLALRPPTMLAKQAASIDMLSGGRFELGLGSGGFREAIAGMGGPMRTPGQSRRALSEAIDIIRASWSGQPFCYRGRIYRAPSVQPGPRPAHEIGVWLGVIAPRSVSLVGAKADGWSISAPYAPPARLPELNNIITDAAQQAGRDPEQIVRLYNVMGLISDTDRDAFHGPVGRWVDTLSRLYTDYQMNAFIYWPTGDRERQAQLFAEQVVPGVREAFAEVAAPTG
jgi:alkanesulfonate monooxygenase SsuD/methylene tetrahydromethanopterin reductase-like flavin-dependent oxidoreductase (luciferase family)